MGVDWGSGLPRSTVTRGRLWLPQSRPEPPQHPAEAPVPLACLSEAPTRKRGGTHCLPRLGEWEEQGGSNVLIPRALSGPEPSTAAPVGGLMLPLELCQELRGSPRPQKNSSAVLGGPNLPESSPVPSSTHRTCQSDLLSCKSRLREENLLTSQFFC